MYYIMYILYIYTVEIYINNILYEKNSTWGTTFIYIFIYLFIYLYIEFI